MRTTRKVGYRPHQHPPIHLQNFLQQHIGEKFNNAEEPDAPTSTSMQCSQHLPSDVLHAWTKLYT